MYHECCTLFGLKQLIKWSTRVTCNSSSFLDHVLDSFPNRVSQSGAIDVGISDHQLIYCTRKSARIKSYCHKQITFHSLKNYSPEIHEEALKKLSFPNYELLDDIDTAYANFIKRSWQLLIILHLVKTNASRVHHKIALMLKSWKK